MIIEQKQEWHFLKYGKQLFGIPEKNPNGI